MNALVVYDTRFGTTRQIAHSIGETLTEAFEVQVVPVAEAAPLPADIALLVIGGPTHAHGMSDAMKLLLGGVGRGALAGVPAATFDTRFQMSRWLTGSAARVIARRLKRAGCRLVMPAESFFVTRGQDVELLPGELDRARAWARQVLAAAPVPGAQPAGR
jgi:flavodoxin